MQARRHNVDFLSDVGQVPVLEMFQVYNLDSYILLIVWRLTVNVLRFPDEAE